MMFEFDGFQLDQERHELRTSKGVIALEPKALALLNLLIVERERAVSREEIFAAIWPDVFVSDASLSTLIRQIRKGLGDDGDRQHFVRTIRGHGFRFVAEVREIVPASLSASPPDRATPQWTSGQPSLAICPFQLIGGGAEFQAIAEAIPAELIATLSKLRWIKVIARASSFQFSQPQSDVSDMVDVLGARFIVSGLVEHIGASLAVFVELLDAHSGEVIWSNRLSGTITTVFEMRERIARDLAIALELRLPMHEVAKLEHRPSENLDAWDHYHLAVRHMYRYNKGDNAIAAAHFSKALDLDPGFARASGGLSYTEFQNAFQHFGSDVARHRDLSLRHAERALTLDPLDPFCNLIYGRVQWLLGKPEDALVWVDKAIATNPNYAFGYFNRATLLNALCEGKRAEKNAAVAVDLSPIDPHLQSMFGTRAFAALLAGDLPSAQQYADRAITAPNPHLYVYTIAALIADRNGYTAKARTCIETIRSKNVAFGRSDFLRHYTLRSNPERRNELETALGRLGL